MTTVRSAVLVLGLVAACFPGDAAAAPLSKPELRCALGLQTCGIRLARAEIERFLACLDAVAAGEQSPGAGAATCLAADSRHQIATARSRTASVAAKRCQDAPAFGLRTADVVNDAFASVLRIAEVFGPGLASVVPEDGDVAGARCQRAVARGMATLTRVQLRETGSCLARVLRSDDPSLVAVRGCVAADPEGRIARVQRQAEKHAVKACRAVSAASLFVGGCAGSTVGDVLTCAGGEARCGACLALDAAGEFGASCRAVGATAKGTICGGTAFPPSVARTWDDEILAAIRIDLPRPPVHARNLFHLSVAMWDAWAAYDASARQYQHAERRTSLDPAHDRAVTISFAAYRLIRQRYALSASAAATRQHIDDRMAALGLDVDYTSTTDDTPAALGNRIAATVLAANLADGANEAINYADPTYVPVNEPLVVKLPGTAMLDPNRWQPLALDVQIGQNGIPIPGKVQIFVGPQWGNVTPFALTRATPNDGYLDPGPPPQVGGVGDALFKARILDMLRYTSQLTIDDGVRIDISPAALGNNTLGTNDGQGYAQNPVTGAPYVPEPVLRGDFARVLAEFWADGPTSETPPGHWNSLANQVNDDPLLVRRIGGTGPELDPLEWDVKLYLALNGALHDAAVQCWGTKRRYDGVRPISMIRYLGGRGQSSDPQGPSYDPLGLPLEPGLIEVITAASSAPGERHAQLADHVGEIAVYTWPGQPADPKTQYSGVRWVRAVDWLPYQRNTFVTPPFAGFSSGHSTYSRSAAELLTRFTGSAYFPGGLGTYSVARNGLLQFEIGPSEPLTLQWARYYDAADQAGISRLYGGIHTATDDFGGRVAGAAIGALAFDKALTYFAPAP
jgi:hypothetical protein